MTWCDICGHAHLMAVPNAVCSRALMGSLNVCCACAVVCIAIWVGLMNNV